MNKHITTMLVAVGLCTSVYAQQSAIYTHDQVQYKQAIELYNNKQFLAAQTLFDKVKEHTKDEEVASDCTYYIANCAIWLNQKEADVLIEDFVEKYPTSIKRNSAFIDVANYYFENGNYAYARKWYDRVDQSNMSNADKEKFNFNNGYANFKAQRFNEAEKFLGLVQESETYGAQAKYYLGFIAYEGDNYEKANKLFDEVKDLEQYNKNLSYFQSDMNFKSGNFQEAITEGLRQLPNTKKANEKSELNKIIGESYFNLGEYDKAIPYLKEYKGFKGKWNNTDYYQLGYAYYKQGDYLSAISEFNKIIDGKNSIAQNAYYHLAESYLKSDQKQQALNAFRNASEMDFDMQIKDDAAYNYAKLSYEVGNSYESVPTVLTNYLEAYKKGEHTEEIQSLLIDSYITSKNYKEAMELLENSRNFEDKIVYQKVAFFRGTELYNEGNYPEAIIYFDKSLTEQRDSKYTAKAIYWKAESEYLLNKYDEALIGFKQFANSSGATETREYAAIDYAIGYTYFKKKEYNKAIEHFKKYSSKRGIDETRKIDAYLRLGDSHFISSQYWPAMETYNKAIKAGGADADYAHYQKAISYGFVNKNDRKIEDLNAFLKNYPRSTYRDDALYALGNVYIAEDQTEKGIATYDQLITELPRSSYVPKTLLKEGLIYYNGDEGNKALAKFKKVVAEYPGTEEAIQAVNTARLIYVDLGRIDEYTNWVKGLDFVEVTDADLDNTRYEAAEKQFHDNNYDAAINGFTKYLEEFPKGLHALKSHFYLAQIYYIQGDKEATIPHYEYVLQEERNEFTEQALARLSQVLLEKRAYEKAIPVLERLEKVADFPQNIIFAQSNLMKSYYQLFKYKETVVYAEKVLENPKIENAIKSDAQIFIARSAIQTGNEDRAKEAYAEVSKIATGELAAEALYYDAYFKTKEKQYEASNKTIQRLAKEYSGYKLYGAKGLMLMAKNFYGLKDAYQATYILETVIKKFTAYPDVITEAKAELKKIKAEEAKTNSSIKTTEDN
ncbi:tetratricopeptide repeat protein [Aquimarina rhabdastrellae]